MSVQHGGDWAGFKIEYGKCPLDFSANTGPLGLPEGIRDAVIASLDHADHYPDPYCRELKNAIAARYAMTADGIACGNGAADIIDRLIKARKPENALITAPTFGEYREALQREACNVEEYPLKEPDEFRIREDILESITPKLDMVILCEPNNPTGITTDRRLLENILYKCRECGCLLVIDECFNEFLEQPEDKSMIGEISGGSLLILRAFTKFYGMAGIRLGWCACKDEKLISDIEHAGQPWNVSLPAQIAGVAALKEKEYETRLRKLIKEQRDILIGGLENMGCRVIKGEANYILFFCEDTQLDFKLREKGILIRHCGNYAGLGENWYRIAVRTEPENRRLLRTLKEVL